MVQKQARQQSKGWSHWEKCAEDSGESEGESEKRAKRLPSTAAIVLTEEEAASYREWQEEDDDLQPQYDPRHALRQGWPLGATDDGIPEEEVSDSGASAMLDDEYDAI